MIISAVDGSPLPPPEVLREALAEQFGDAYVALSVGKLVGIMGEFRISVSPEGGPHFQIGDLSTGSLDSDGTAGQNAMVGAAVASVLPATASRVIAFDSETNTFVDLAPGMSATDVANGWRDISEGGF